jgi:hypothetical protein
MKNTILQPEREIHIPATSGIAVQSAVNLSKEKDSKWGGVDLFISEKDERKMDHRSIGQSPKYCRDQK